MGPFLLPQKPGLAGVYSKKTAQPPVFRNGFAAPPAPCPNFLASRLIFILQQFAEICHFCKKKNCLKRTLPVRQFLRLFYLCLGFFSIVRLFNQLVDNRSVVQKIAQALVVMNSCNYIRKKTRNICAYKPFFFF